jgi:hypothetical protein
VEIQGRSVNRQYRRRTSVHDLRLWEKVAWLDRYFSTFRFRSLGIVYLKRESLTRYGSTFGLGIKVSHDGPITVYEDGIPVRNIA